MRLCCMKERTHNRDDVAGGNPTTHSGNEALRSADHAHLDEGGIGGTWSFDGPSYRRFVFSLERGLACDALQWGYVQRTAGRGELRIGVDLDEG